jgi:MoaA/NifB/PqqE/SkfB family radical SAM enzyme
MDKIIQNGCITLFLNRACPRSCVYCDVVNPELESRRLHYEEWRRAFSILESEGAEFFLCVGTEPLLMGSEIVELVKFWKKRDYEYALYTSANKSLVEKFSGLLIAAGLRNWSSGIDFVPEVFELLRLEGKLSEECISLVDSEKNGLVLKAGDGLDGMRIMIPTSVEELHAVITISRMNIEMVPEMVSWLIRELGVKSHIAFNYVETNKGDLDFARSAEQCSPYIFGEKDEPVFREFVRKMRNLPESDWLRIQVPFDYVDNWDRVLNLNYPPSKDYCVMGVDCDGSLRKCGYGRGNWVSEFNILDAENSHNRFLIRSAWERDVEECPGCYWVFPYLLRTVGKKVVNYRSDWWQGRDSEWSKGE